MLADDSYKPDLRSLAILAGTAEDKEQLLRGEATARVESVHGSTGVDDFERQLAALQRADVEEVRSMGSGERDSAAKGGLIGSGPACPGGAAERDDCEGCDDAQKGVE